MLSVMLYLCMFCVALSMDLFVLCVACLTLFANCLGKQFAICLGLFVIECDGVVKCGCSPYVVSLYDFAYYVFG